MGQEGDDQYILLKKCSMERKESYKWKLQQVYQKEYNQMYSEIGFKIGLGLF